MSWPKANLGDHVDLLTGFPFKSAHFTTGTSGVRLLRGANIAPGGLDWNNLRRLPASVAEGYAGYLLQEGDVVLAMDRPWIEAGLKSGYVSSEDLPALLVQRVSRMRGANGLLTSYLRYLVGSPEFTDYIAPIVTGVNVPHISPTQIKGFRFALPPLDTQRKITAILAAYDDLIENNNRRIKILEEMAQRIYREWFVDFRYPGHEDIPFVESEWGPLPEGWSIVALSDLATVTMGQSPPSNAYNRDRIGLPFHQGVGTYGEHFPRHEVYSTVGARLAYDGNILVSVRAPVGRINMADRQLILGRGLCGISARVTPNGFLLYALRHVFREEDSMGNGAIFKSVTKRDMSAVELVWPGIAAAEQFSGVAEPMWSEIRLLTQSTVNARETRDLLLPRLISGEVDVTDLDVVFRDIAG